MTAEMVDFKIDLLDIKRSVAEEVGDDITLRLKFTPIDQMSKLQKPQLARLRARMLGKGRKDRSTMAASMKWFHLMRAGRTLRTQWMVRKHISKLLNFKNDCL